MADEPSTEQQEKVPAKRPRSEPKAESQTEPQAEQSEVTAETEGTEHSGMPDVPVSQLIEDSQAFLGYPAHTAAGALGDHDPEEMMSIDAAKGAIEEWLQRPVEVAGEEE